MEKTQGYLPIGKHKAASPYLLRSSTILALAFLLAACTSNGGIIVNDIPLDLVVKNRHCAEAEEACRRAHAMARDLDARTDLSSDAYFDLQRAYEAQAAACEEAYTRCQPGDI